MENLGKENQNKRAEMSQMCTLNVIENPIPSNQNGSAENGGFV